MTSGWIKNIPPIETLFWLYGRMQGLLQRSVRYRSNDFVQEFRHVAIDFFLIHRWKLNHFQIRFSFSNKSSNNSNFMRKKLHIYIFTNCISSNLFNFQLLNKFIAYIYTKTVCSRCTYLPCVYARAHVCVCTSTAF